MDLCVWERGTFEENGRLRFPMILTKPQQPHPHQVVKMFINKHKRDTHERMTVFSIFNLIDLE